MSADPEMGAFIARLNAIRDELSGRTMPGDAGQRAAMLLDRLARRLARPPRIVILGEVNSGKTTLANALIGADLLNPDVIHNTRTPVLLRHAAVPMARLRRPGGLESVDLTPESATSLTSDSLIEVAVPIDRLGEFEIVDTPGMGSAEASDPQSTVVRQADIVIWCTLATQAWKASEVVACRALGRRLARDGILAVTHADLLGLSDQDKVRHRLEVATSGQFRAFALAAMPDRIVTEATGEREAGAAEILEAIREAVADVHRRRRLKAVQLVRRYASRLPDETPGGQPGGQPYEAMLQAAE